MSQTQLKTLAERAKKDRARGKSGVVTVVVPDIKAQAQYPSPMEKLAAAKSN